MDTTCHHLAAIWKLSTERISTLKTAFGHCLSTVLSEGCYYDDLIVSWKWLFPRQPSLIADCDLKDAIWAIRGELTGLNSGQSIPFGIGLETFKKILHSRLRNESDRNGSLGWLSGVILLFSIVQIFMSAAISYFYRTQNSVSHVWNLFQIVGFVKIDTWISISCYMDLSKSLHGQSCYMDLSILFLALCQTKPRLSWTKVVEASALN